MPVRSPGRLGRRAALLPIPAALAGCTGMQSMLETHGPEAEWIALIAWIVFVGGTAIFVGVMALAAYALLAPRRWTRPIGRQSLVIGGGIVFPVVVLSALLGWTLSVADTMAPAGGGAALRVEVIGRMWWWEVRYPDAGPDGFVTANEIHVPVGRQVELTLLAADVIHSFWVPSLAGKLDMIPGHRNTLRIEATRPGAFRGQCAEYCGAQHAHMAFFVVAHPPEEFAAWLAREAGPAREPEAPALRQGRALFLDSGCGACHAVRGTPADGRFGPDLTHVGSRRTIGAGMLPNNIGTLAGWIADSQQIKPGNHMPSFNTFTGAELRTLAAYLASLE